MNGKEKIISIYSGIGVMDLGFKDDFDIVLAVEKEKPACATLEANKSTFHPYMEVWERDILTTSEEEILRWKGVTGLIGGPNCQPFSPGKHGFDPEDNRISGLTEFLRWLRLLEPEFFVFENTFGIMQGQKKVFYDFFKEEAEKCGYIVSERIMNAHDYGSVQERKRLVSIGVQKTANWTFAFPEPIADSEKKYVRDIIKDEPLGECMFYSESRAEIVKHVPPGGHWRNLPTEELKIKALGEKNYFTPQGGMTGAYRRLHPDKPCPTLVTNPCQRNTMLTSPDPAQNRPLSVNEYRRAMGIPEDFILTGSVAAKYKAIGNAVPRELAEAISKALVSSMSKRTPVPKFDVKPEPVNTYKVEVDLPPEQWEQLQLVF